jgi:hypothetical protein
MTPNAIRSEILRACAQRGNEKTICPSEVARSLVPEGWRDWMNPVRREAVQLAKEGKIRIMQRGREVDPSGFKGPIRLQWIPPR